MREPLSILFLRDAKNYIDQTKMWFQISQVSVHCQRVHQGLNPVLIIKAGTMGVIQELRSTGANEAEMASAELLREAFTNITTLMSPYSSSLASSVDVYPQVVDIG